MAAALLAPLTRHLESLALVESVDVAPNVPATAADIARWERLNQPFRLPRDLVAMLLVCNGAHAVWRVRVRGEMPLLGCVHVNTLAELQRLEGPLAGAALLDMGRERVRVGPAGAAFNLDSCCVDGRVALVYTAPDASPCVCYQDVSGAWHLVAESFGNYLRLLLAHAGVPRWLLAFTPLGLDPVAETWLRLVVPARLALDRRALAALAADKKGGGGEAASASAEAAAAPPASVAAQPRDDAQRNAVDFERIDAVARAAAAEARRADRELRRVAGARRPRRPSSAARGAGCAPVAASVDRPGSAAASKRGPRASRRQP
jgi:hypothetical protein